MRRRFLLVLFSLSLAAGTTAFPEGAGAQEAAKEGSGSKELTARRPGNIYRLEYMLHELENGKHINTRNYTLMVSAGSLFAANAANVGDWTGFRVGSRIPMATGKDQLQWQYFDLGVKINCRLKERENDLLVETNLEINSVAEAEITSVPKTPVIRSLSLSSITQAVPGKPALVGSVDDVTANRRYEIQVMAAKAK